MSDEEPDAQDAEDPQPSAVDDKANKRIRNRKKREEAQREKFWKDVFSSEVGRREMWGLLSKLHPFQVMAGTTPVGMADERMTWMHLAEQLVGQHLFQEWFNMEPELVLQMRAENDKRFQKAKG